jgi:cobalt-zinc-cadmium efflux system protein
VGIHHDHESVTGQRLVLSIIITVVFVAAELIAGYFSHSLALLSDAAHNFSDTLALGFTWYGVWMARKPSNSKRTYGHHRVGILAALVNSVSLVVIALLIFWEAAQRFRAPAPVQSTPMIVVALLAVAVNTMISLWLRKAAAHDLNLRSAYLHTLGDAVSGLGVVIAGVIIALTGAAIADQIVSILIGLLILWSSWGILKASVNVLLEGIPEGMDMEAVANTICAVPGVMEVHDLHVWTVGSGIVACSCHIMVEEQSIRSGQNVLRSVADELKRKFGILHTTIQVEAEGCDPNDMYCLLKIAQLPHKH